MSPNKTHIPQKTEAPLTVPLKSVFFRRDPRFARNHNWFQPEGGGGATSARPTTNTSGYR